MYLSAALYSQTRNTGMSKIMGVHHPRLLIFAVGNRGVNELLHSSLFYHWSNALKNHRF